MSYIHAPPRMHTQLRHYTHDSHVSHFSEECIREEEIESQSSRQHRPSLLSCTCVVLILHQPPLWMIPLVGKQQVGGVAHISVVGLYKSDIHVDPPADVRTTHNNYEKSTLWF